MGYGTLKSSTAGKENVAVGDEAMQSASSGSNNTCIGYRAGHTITTGIQNVMVGTGCDGGTTGNNNISVGISLSTADTGSNNIMIGYACAPSSSSVSNEGILSTSNVTGQGANTFFITPNGGNVFQGNNSANWATTSDERIKKNIVDNTTGLDAINQIQVRNFEYRTEDEITDFDNPASAVVNEQGLQLGVIAQEIQTVLPDMVKEESTGVLSVNPDNMTWYLVNAVKELSAQITELQSEIATLKGE